ncbi:metaxin-3 isoform X1 [Tachysurus fulvidraco]|uniref:metaxin-3 isoform X1 n=1 Tax=Tachysurus fulvidraco TaxID=1234273 RepID=UPI001FEF6339|nr:metaxin-3 isoform X1 [Tachysurus fulvidraco]
MAAPMELLCWGGDWDLPSVHTESLIVLAYAKFAGVNLTVKLVDWTWRTITATVPQLHHGGSSVTEPTQILNFLRQNRFNADYELSAKQGADTMAYIALLEEKLKPALLHTFWVDAENYANLTRPWFASHSPFPLNFIVPSRQASVALSRILLTKAEAPLHSVAEVEGKIYSEAKECLNLLSHRLGSSHFFFGNTWMIICAVALNTDPADPIKLKPNLHLWQLIGTYPLPDNLTHTTQWYRSLPFYLCVYYPRDNKMGMTAGGVTSFLTHSIFTSISHNIKTTCQLLPLCHQTALSHRGMDYTRPLNVCCGIWPQVCSRS